MIFMDSCIFLSVLLVFLLNPFRIESLNLSEDEDLGLEKQLKLLNKPAIKTINTEHGDVYDCVDFYKQPAFDHPRLKNFTFEKSTLLRIQKKGRLSSEINHGIALERGGCPLGTVPIKRTTKEDLIREKTASKVISSLAGAKPNIDQRRPEVPPEIYKKYAIARTKASSKRYAGMSANISIHNPQCVDQQYSAARIKMINGPDSIEAGWRVDPYTSGDSLTRFYIRTDAGQSHCYNVRCPGFVITSAHVPLEKVASKISKFGGPSYVVPVSIFKTELGLILQVGPKNDLIGFWPMKIFTSPGGLSELASSLNWGGEVFSPPGSPKPPMGIGDLPVSNMKYSAYLSFMLERDEHGAILSADDVETFADSTHFQVIDKGQTQTPAGHIIFYGGPGGSTD